MVVAQWGRINKQIIEMKLSRSFHTRATLLGWTSLGSSKVTPEFWLMIPFMPDRIHQLSFQQRKSQILWKSEVSLQNYHAPLYDQADEPGLIRDATWDVLEKEVCGGHAIVRGWSTALTRSLSFNYTFVFPSFLFSSLNKIKAYSSFHSISAW